MGFLCCSVVTNLPAMQETWVWSLVGKIPWRRERLPTPVFWPGEFHGPYSPWGSQKVGHDWETFILHSSHIHINRHFILHSLVIPALGNQYPVFYFHVIYEKLKMFLSPVLGLYIHTYIHIYICIYICIL